MSLEINSTNFEEIIKNKEELVLVDFWAAWCGPCKIIGPFLDELSIQFENNLIVAKVNVDENPELAAQFGIRNIPTILFFKKGEIVDKSVGVSNKANLENKINSLI